METLRYKTRIAVLWVIMAVCISAHSIMIAADPTAMERMAEEAAAMGPGMWLFMALFWLVPLWMAFVTMTVKGSCNRWANLVLGIIFTILNIWNLIEGLAEPTVEQILIVGSMVVATGLIAWYAWQLPKREP